MEFKVVGRRSVGWSKKTWSKVVEEDMKKLNFTEDMAEDRKLWRQLISCPPPASEKLGTLNDNDDDDDDGEGDDDMFMEVNCFYCTYRVSIIS